MATPCEFPSLRAGARCRRCGFRLTADVTRHPLRSCPQRCASLGEPTDDEIAVECVTCGGTSIVRIPVYACAIFRECLPDYRCRKDAISETASRDVQPCKGCERFEPATPQ